LFLSFLHFKVNIVKIAEVVLVSLFLPPQGGHFIDFPVVHNFQHVLGRVGTQIFDIDSIRIESSLRHAWSLLDFLQNDDEVFDTAVQEIERLVN